MKRTCVVGHKGMLGHAICEELKEKIGCIEVIGCDLPEIDLTNQEMAMNFFKRERPDEIYFLAAVSAGISYKKKYPADMLLKNLQIIVNVMEGAQKYGCKKMINVCSALLYPKNAEIPISEKAAKYSDLGNDIDIPYSLAKAVSMQLGKFYNKQYGMNILTVVPCNFFGEYAVFEGERAGVIPSLIARFHNAKVNHDNVVEVWGSGAACREFLYSKDVASACIFLMEQNTELKLINIGCGMEYTIREVAEMIGAVVGFEGEIFFDSSKPEGRKSVLLDSSVLQKLGWKPKVELKESIEKTYAWYLSKIK